MKNTQLYDGRTQNKLHVSKAPFVPMLTGMEYWHLLEGRPPHSEGVELMQISAVLYMSTTPFSFYRISTGYIATGERTLQMVAIGGSSLYDFYNIYFHADF